MENVRLDFFGLSTELRSDVPLVAAYCRELFAPFLVTRADPPQYWLEILERPGGLWSVRDSWIRDAVVREAEWLPGVVAARMLEAAGNGVEDRYLFHAAALARGGNGLILAGESGFGKSTLTLGLVQRGWQFLSDEIAAVDARDGRLLPFPKALELRPDTAARFSVEPTGTHSRAGKQLCDVTRAFPGCLGEPCALRAVVFLDGGMPARPEKPGRAVRIRTHDRDDAVLPEIARLEGVAHARWEEDQGGPTLVLDADPLHLRGWEIEDVLGRRGLLVMSSSFDEAPPLDFDLAPQLEALATHTGVAALLARFRGSRAVARLVEQRGGFGGLFLSLVDLFRGARFYRLSAGRLVLSFELLEAALAGTPNPTAASKARV